MLKQILIGIAAIIGVVVIALLIFLAQNGFFTKVLVEEKEVGPYVLIYEEHTGDYAGMKDVTYRVYNKLLNEDKIMTTKGFGIYYDNPRNVPKDKLRSIGGCILDEKDYDKIAVLEKKYKIKKIEKQRSLVADFPFRNRMSIIMGIMKVYPEMNEYVSSKHYQFAEVMEIYDMPNKKITYVMWLK